LNQEGVWSQAQGIDGLNLCGSRLAKHVPKADGRAEPEVSE
jgi:hypothetical protein